MFTHTHDIRTWRDKYGMNSIDKKPNGSSYNHILEIRASLYKFCFDADSLPLMAFQRLVNGLCNSNRC